MTIDTRHSRRAGSWIGSRVFVLKKFFSERSSSMSEEISLRNPMLCRLFLVSLFNQLAADLSDKVLRANEEVHCRVRLAREIGMSPETKSAPGKTKSAASNSSEFIKEAQKKVCAGHLGRLLKAVSADGKPHACAYGKKCKFTHVGLARKTDQNLLDLIAVMPDPASGDLKKALNKRSCLEQQVESKSNTVSFALLSCSCRAGFETSGLFCMRSVVMSTVRNISMRDSFYVVKCSMILLSRGLASSTRQLSRSSRRHHYSSTHRVRSPSHVGTI